MLDAFVDEDNNDDVDDKEFKRDFRESALHIFFRLPPIVLERSVRRTVVNKWNLTRDHLKEMLQRKREYRRMRGVYSSLALRAFTHSNKFNDVEINESKFVANNDKSMPTLVVK
jgi:hypothetical protein